MGPLISSVLLVLLFLGPIGALGQDEDSVWNDGATPEEAPTGGEDSMPPNPEMQTLVKKATQGALQVAREEDRILVIPLHGTAVPHGTQILFVRIEQDTVDILARGQPLSENGGNLYVELVQDSIVKFPRPGDQVVFVSKPWEPKPLGPEQELSADIKTEAPPLDSYPGFLQIDYGANFGKLTSDTPNQVNQYKESSFQFSYFHFEWYLQFAWQFGLELESYSGLYPTSTYFREDLNTSQNYSVFYVNYRLRPRWWKEKIRPTFRLVSITDEMSTKNSDEALISSIYTGFGLGGRLAYELSSMVWRPPEGSRWGHQANLLYADVNLYPAISAKDLSVSRGTSGKGFAYEARLGATYLFYLDYVPLFKRYTLNVYYGLRHYSISFSGATEGEDAINAYKIPGGATYDETVSYYMITLGVRMDDFIGTFLQPRQR